MVLICCAIIIVLPIFVFSFLSEIDPTSRAGIIGFVFGGFIGLFGTIVSAIITMWSKGKDVEEERKGRAIRCALELTEMDYKLRQQSLKSRGGEQEFLAPVKVYREFYKALLQLHTTGAWPKKPEQLGLLNTYIVRSETDKQNKAENSNR